MRFPSGLIKKRKASELEAPDKNKWSKQIPSQGDLLWIATCFLHWGKIDSGSSCFYMSSSLWIHIYCQSFMYLSPSEWYHGVRANWTLVLWEYKYHVKESDPGLLRICTLPTDKGINSPLMDQSSWIYDLKMSFNMKLGSQVFPPETACWVLTWWRKSEPPLLCFSYLLFFSSLVAFPFH